MRLRDRHTTVWTQALERYIRTMGSERRKQHWHKMWREAGEQFIREYEREQRLRESV